MIDVAVLRAMAAAGASIEAILAAIEVDQIADKELIAARRNKERIKKQNQRSRPRMSPGHEGTPPSPFPERKVSPCTPSKETNPSPPPSSLRSDSCGDDFARRTRAQAFEEFWREYPKRDGANPRKPAERKFVAILLAGTATFDEIMAGVRRSRKQHQVKNEIGTSFVPMATTWLNQQRWLDEQQPSLPLLSIVSKGPSALDLELIAETRLRNGGAHV